ncbi:MAG: hypothetical protein QXI11_08605, partial [Thermoproteota archaeon]
YRKVEVRMKVFLLNLSERIPETRGMKEYINPPVAPINPSSSGEASSSAAYIGTVIPTIPVSICIRKAEANRKLEVRLLPRFMLSIST